MNTRAREKIAEELARYEEAFEKNAGASQRTIVEELGVPPSSLRHWLSRKEPIDAAPEVVAFFESCAGVAFLHRLVLEHTLFLRYAVRAAFV